MHVFLHFKSFCLVVLQLILASKLSELEQFEKQAENCLFADKIEFFGKWLHPFTMHVNLSSEHTIYLQGESKKSGISKNFKLL